MVKEGMGIGGLVNGEIVTGVNGSRQISVLRGKFDRLSCELRITPIIRD